MDSPTKPANLIAAVDALRSPEFKSKYRLEPGQCAYCDANRDDSMMPSHTASDRCESGKRPHCTCDTCY